MSKNNSRSFGGNRKGPGYRTPSSFKLRAALRNRNNKRPLNGLDSHNPSPYGRSS